ncbi:MAG: cupin domain-containing protein [bacterium]
MIKPTGLFLDAAAIPWEVVGDGVKRKILGYNDTMMMTIVEFKIGSIGPVHSHHHTQVTYVNQGSFEVEIDGKKQVLRQGDCFLIPSQVFHGVVALEDGVLVDTFTPAREDFLVQKM